MVYFSINIRIRMAHKEKTLVFISPGNYPVSDICLFGDQPTSDVLILMIIPPPKKWKSGSSWFLLQLMLLWSHPSLADFCALVFCEFFDSNLHSVKAFFPPLKKHPSSRIPDQYSKDGSDKLLKSFTCSEFNSGVFFLFFSWAAPVVKL